MSTVIAELYAIILDRDREIVKLRGEIERLEEEGKKALAAAMAASIELNKEREKARVK